VKDDLYEKSKDLLNAANSLEAFTLKAPALQQMKK
jgi:hypothetical protein